MKRSKIRVTFHGRYTNAQQSHDAGLFDGIHHDCARPSGTRIQGVTNAGEGETRFTTLCYVIQDRKWCPEYQAIQSFMVDIAGEKTYFTQIEMKVEEVDV